MRRIPLIASLALVALPLFAADSPLWGDLVPGPYAVGFREMDRYDYSRVHRLARDLEGNVRTGERARPIAVSIWYPAEKTDRAPMTWGDYLALVANEEHFGPITDAQRQQRIGATFRFGVLANLAPAQIKELSGLRTMTYRDATPLAGPFPLILYSLGSAVLAHVTPEYLASYGYVVVQSPRVGKFAGLPPDNFDAGDLIEKVKDFDFLVNVMHDFPSADIHNIGALGFSAGGRWVLSKAMNDPDVRAVVSLDSVALFNDQVGAAWKTLPFYNLDAVRVPVLHMIRRAWVPQEDQSIWSSMRYADRTKMVFEDPRLDHFDFQSAGFATALIGTRGDATDAVVQAFDLFNRYTLAFFNAYLKNDSNARAFLAKSPEENGAGAKFVTLTRTPAEAAPLTVADVLNEIDDGNIDAVVRLYTSNDNKTRPALPEAVLNVVGYNLVGSGRVAEGIRIFKLNAATYPKSANAYDSLGDAYLAAGDKAAALEASQKALALLETDPSDPGRKQLIRASIDAKLKQLKSGQ